MKLLNVPSSPHMRHGDTTFGVMLDVIIALLPAAVYGCILFGWYAAVLLAVTVAAAVCAEWVWNRLLHKENSLFDLSAVLTGLLLGLNLPPRTPVWIAAIGSIVAIIVVKQMFGGIGHNFANPAIAARIVLLVSFPAQMTKFINPAMYGIDAMTSATPLASEAGTFTVRQLFFGMHPGCIGETSSFLLLCGGLYLILRRVIHPITPIAFIGTVALMALLFGENVSLYVFGGGLFIGAFFMATDYTTSPTDPLGKLIFGVGCGLLTFVIRKWAALPEGVSYAILLMNIVTPHINTLTRHQPFGAKEVGRNG